MSVKKGLKHCLMSVIAFDLNVITGHKRGSNLGRCRVNYYRLDFLEEGSLKVCFVCGRE
ncbi:MAG: hypothetical protein QFX31_06930 [Methanothrix sp.]|uniref:hypothetical protein n=1 Tax=Methanothrix sp. TaxID=90426 RepID=UPI003171791E|nr:hypothetical protein [Methanothrix sp.]